MGKTILLVRKLLDTTILEEDEKLVKALVLEARNLLLGVSPRYTYDLYNSGVKCPSADIYCDLYEEVFSDAQN